MSKRIADRPLVLRSLKEQLDKVPHDLPAHNASSPPQNNPAQLLHQARRQAAPQVLYTPTTPLLGGLPGAPGQTRPRQRAPFALVVELTQNPGATDPLRWYVRGPLRLIAHSLSHGLVQICGCA
jgi:hypothetical protein